MLSTEARAVHEAAVVIDLHADTPKLMARGYKITRRHNPPWPIRSYAGHVDLPRMRDGGLTAQWFGMWTSPVSLPRMSRAADVHHQLDALERAAAADPNQLRLALTGDDVRIAKNDGVAVGLRGIEGGQALEGDLANLTAFARRGVRYLGLLHFSRNELGYPALGLGQAKGRGLTRFGRDVVEACADLGVIIDLAHLNRTGFDEVIANTNTPVIVSHTGVAGVRAHWRNIDDDQVRAVADTGGVVGIIFSPRFVGGDMDAVVEHLAHVVNVAGPDAVALGSDWDGMVRPARGLEDPTGLPHLTEALLRRGMSAATVTKLLGANVLRVLDAVPAR
ncbi:MAG: membrane dipeptidase [Actinobacteria bacterium]|nr:membrane dipeptidase [Actinomycetota bacterium]